MPFGDVGRILIAHLYNSRTPRATAARLEAVYNCKEDSKGKWVRDIERGVADGISPEPWQTDTSIGDWYYRTGQKYMTSGEVVRMLADIVSKNGNLLLNVVQTPEGDLEPDVLKMLDGIGPWIAVNGEGIYGTRPWKVYGEGPSTSRAGKGPFRRTQGRAHQAIHGRRISASPPPRTAARFMPSVSPFRKRNSGSFRWARIPS